MNIPENAYIAYEGGLCRVWERKQDMFDGGVKIFERVEKNGSVTIFAVSGEEILLAYQKQPHRKDWYWDFLGGRVPFDIDMFEQAKNELLEESGLVAETRRLLRDIPVTGYMFNKKHYYLAKNLKKVAEQSLDPGGEMIEVKSLDFDSMIDMIIQGELGDVYLRNEILLMKIEGRIEAFRQKLFA